LRNDTHLVTALDAGSRLLAFLALSRKPTPGSPSPEALDAQAEAVMPAAAAKVIAQHKRHAEASAPQPRPPIVVKIAAIEAKAACGSEDVDLCRSIVTDAVLAYDAELDEKARAAIAALKDITPRNAREALIARRMLALDAMSMESLMRDLERTDYGNPKACRACPLRARCTNDARSVFRLENEDVLDRMAERLKARPAILDRRREVVEHPFGSIKQWMYQGAFLMRGLANVRAEFSLTALAYNLRRALNILGVEAMTAAVAA
jgi:hypothetical protein